MPDITGLFPDFKNFKVQIPPPNPLIKVAVENYASAFYKRLTEWINNFDASLNQEHEVGVRLVTFGQTVVFHLNSLGYSNPSLICFYGTMDDGSPVELIQHVRQISLLLTKLPRKDPSAPKRPIGFTTESEVGKNERRWRLR